MVPLPVLRLALVTAVLASLPAPARSIHLPHKAGWHVESGDAAEQSWRPHDPPPAADEARDGAGEDEGRGRRSRALNSGCTPPADDRSVFYNRIPKAGSTSMKSLAGVLSKVNGYTHISHPVWDDRGLFDPEKERENSQRIQEVFDGDDFVLYDQHVRYINFSKYHIQQPVYINMVREPISRMVSTYYFLRTGNHHDSQNFRERKGEKAFWSINTCLERGLPDCSLLRHDKKYFNLMTMFFCGHDPICADPSDESLALAKLNIREHFQFVGITERFVDSVRVLEQVLPKYFKNGSAVFEAFRSKLKTNKNKRAGEKPTKESWEYLRSLCRFDVELYSYATELFEERWAACFGR